MKRLKFDWLMLALSFAFSLVGAFICLGFMDEAADTVAGSIIWSAVFFAIPLVCSLLGVALTEYIRSRTYILHKTGNRFLSVIVAALIALVLGGCGQALYMIDIEWNSQNEPINVTDKPTDEPAADDKDGINVVLLMDSSLSMDEVFDVCKDAACELIDDLDENTSLQYVSFSNIIFYQTDLMPLDEDGKEIVKNSVNNTICIGSTRFNNPLRIAHDTLDENSTDGKESSVIVITDGENEDDVDEALIDQFIEDNITVHLISIETEDSKQGGKNGLERIVNKTDGLEIEIEGNVLNTDNLLEALYSAYTGENPNEEVERGDVSDNEDTNPEKGLSIVYGDGILAFGFENFGFLKFIIRTFIFILYAVLSSWTIYYSMSKRTLLMCTITGVAVSLLATLIGGFGVVGAVIVMIIFDIAFWSAFTMYYPTRGDV